MEKQGIIEPGRTPPEPQPDKPSKDSKQASAEELESHVTRRAADAVKDQINK